MDRGLLRPATADDAEAIAALHADSWRRHYRGAYADAFLDGDVFGDRLGIWTDRLAQSRDDACTLVAEAAGAVVGFAHVILDAHPVFGALLDNLHVDARWQRQGVGARLIGRVAEVVVDRRPDSWLHLWVLEQNRAAQRFYRSMAGQCLGASAVPPVGGVDGRLEGSPLRLRYVWPDPAVLAARSSERHGPSSAGRVVRS